MKCPGQDSRYWKPGAIFDVKCPSCGTMIEFFKDDTRRRCPSCGADVPNPEMDFGCAAYCPYAEHCLGTLPEGVVADGKMKVLKAKMLKALKEKDLKEGRNAALTSRFMELAEEIGKKESAPLGPVMLAAFGYSMGAFHDKEGVQQITDVKGMLERALCDLGLESDAVEEASTILTNIISQKEKDYLLPEQVLLDAWKLANLEYAERDRGEQSIELYTDTAKQIILNKRAGK